MVKRAKRAVFVLLTSLSLGVAGAAASEAGSVGLQILAPKSGDVAGVGSRAFLVDLVAKFDGPLDATGASPELTGPGAHANTAPFPGTFSPGASADHFPGLVVLLSSTRIGAGPGQNVASRLFVAVLNGSAPGVVQDLDGNGVFDEKDLRLMGVHVISNVVKVDFVVNGL